MALLYRRVSSEEQAREGVSLEAQLAETRRYAGRKGWFIGGEFFDVLSGTRPDRSQYVAMLAEARRLAESGRTTAIVVARLDRFGRSVLERARCAEEFRALGVPIHSAREGGLLPGLVSDLLAAVAQEEVRRLGEHLLATRRFVADSGWHYPTRPAWGYLRRLATAEERAQGAPHTVLDIDPTRARHVREAFRRAARGDSVAKIATWVRGLPEDARSGRKMSYINIRGLLRRPVYIARHIQGPEDVLARPRMRWPSLISDKQWRRVQERLAARSVRKEASRRKYLLAGLIRCGRCGARMGGNRNQPTLALTHGWSRQARYICMGRIGGKDGLSRTCYETAVMPAVDARVVETVTALFRHGTREQLKPGALASPEDDARVQDEAMVRAISRAQRRLARAAMRMIDGEISTGAYQRTRDRILSSLSDAQIEVSVAGPARRADPGAEDAHNEAVRLAAAWFAAIEVNDTGTLRKILLELVTSVFPKRVSRGEYKARLEWTSLARQAFASARTLRSQ